jgi:gas vesicle protein
MSYHEDKGFNSGSVLLAFLLGGIVGAGIALLVAPQSGAETRRKIKEMSDEAQKKADEFAATAKGRVTETVDKAKGYYAEKKSAINSAVEAGKKAYEKEVKK